MWNVGSVTKSKILHRAIFLETIAAIPGMVAAIIRVSSSSLTRQLVLYTASTLT
jgi:hypothetical protein